MSPYARCRRHDVEKGELVKEVVLARGDGYNLLGVGVELWVRHVVCV